MVSGNVDATVCFLARLPRYEKEKPCVIVPPAEPRPIDGVNPPNVQRDLKEGVSITDVRPFKEQLRLDDHGFEVLQHTASNLELEDQESVEAYKRENEELLKKHMGAEKVVTWGIKKRQPNKRKPGEKWDYHNQVEIEGPAVMAHCDFTWDRGLTMVEHFLGKEELQSYRDRGYRVRICNVWRPLLPVIENQPLAICDKRSVNMKDLVSCDRVLVDQAGEIYLLQHNPEQKWYWLNSQTNTEPFLFCTWDSKYPGMQNHSPHVSFHGHEVRPDAPPRFSVEARSIVVTPPEAPETPALPQPKRKSLQEYLESWSFRALWASLAI